MLTVIIPAYNASTTVARAVETALQSAVVDDVIVVDDGSTETLPPLCDRRCRVMHTPHVGPHKARLAALAQVSTPWVTFVDADDRVEPHAFDRCVDERADVVQMRVVNVLRGGLRFAAKVPQPERFAAAMLYDDRLFPVQIWGKVYRTELLRRADVSDYGGVWGEDRLVNLAVAELHPRIATTRARYYYNWRGGMTKGRWHSHLADIKRVHAFKAARHPECRRQIDAELVRFLEHDIRRRLDVGTMSLEWLRGEMEREPWTSLPDLPPPETLLRRNRQSVSRHVKRLLRPLLM